MSRSTGTKTNSTRGKLQTSPHLQQPSRDSDQLPKPPSSKRLCELNDLGLGGDWLVQDLSLSGVHRDETVAQALYTARRTGQTQFIYMAIRFSRPSFLITNQVGSISPEPEQVMVVQPEGKILLYINRQVLGQLAV